MLQDYNVSAPPPVPVNEAERLEALHSYDVLDSIKEEEFDRITELASIICDTPISLFSLVDENRVWVKSAYGLDVEEAPREESMCQHTIMGNEIFEVKDTSADDRFQNNTQLNNEQNVGFYAGHPLIDPNGYALGALCVVGYEPKALTEQQKKALALLAQKVVSLICERKAKAELRNFQKIFEFSSDLMFVGNQAGYFKKINPSFEKLFGWSTAYLLKTPHFDFLHPDDLESTIKELDKLANGLPTTNFIQRFRCKSGEYKYIQWTSTPEIATGLIYGIGRDITEKHKIQEELNYTRELLEQTNQVARIGGWNFDVKNQKIFWTSVTKQIHEVDLSYEPEINHAIRFFKEGENRTLILNALEMAISQGKPYDVQLQIVTAKGKEIWVRAIGSPVFEHGECIRLFGTFQDIDGYKTAEIALKQAIENQEKLNRVLIRANDELFFAQNSMRSLNTELINSEQKFRSLIEQAPIAINVFNTRDLLISVVNNRMLDIWGRSADIIGRPLALVLPELQGQPYLKILDDVFTTGITYHGNENKGIINKKGKLVERYFNLIYQPIRDKDGVITGILHLASDVTDQVNDRIKIEQVEENLRMAVDAASMGTYSVNSRTLAFYASARFKELLGFKADEEVSFKACIRQIRADYVQGAFAKIKAAVNRGGRFEMQYPVVGFHNKQVRWLKVIGNLQHSNKPADEIFTGVVMDITEQKQDELRKNDFISIVSHELKTPLTSINGYLQILTGRAKKAEDMVAAVILDKTVVQTRKMTTMINGFLNVSRLESGKIHIDKQHFNMANLLREIATETLNIITSHKIVFEPVAQVYVHADRDKIEQVINNLISNAVKYSPAGSAINVNCCLQTDKICFSVKDAGMGVSKKDIEKLFDRYYRVEGKQMHNISGFGIGLYLCAEIIQRHEGKIWVESEVDKGSTFYFDLPLNI